MSARTEFQKAVRALAGEYQNIQTVRLGKLDGVTVETGTAGVLWARQWNGKEIKVINRALTPPTWDLRVLVGTYRTQPNKWFILQTMEDYLTPAAAGQIANHHTQHEFPGSDTVWVNRKQITNFTVLVSDGANFVVKVYGGVAVTPNGVQLLTTQTLDLSSYVPAGGAIFASIEVDDDLALSVNDGGTNFGSPLAGAVTYVPEPDPGKYMIAYISLYAGQTELLDADIVIPTPIQMVPKDAGLQISEASADTPADGDKFGFWDIVDSALKSITWLNIKATLKTYLDTLYAALVHAHSEYQGELLMQDGVTAPPVPVENEAQDDWLYEDT